MPALNHAYGPWVPNGVGTHAAACQRPGCSHGKVKPCAMHKASAAEDCPSVCLVCGVFGKHALERTNDVCTTGLHHRTISANGETTVFAAYAPFDGVLALITVAREYNGEVIPFGDEVRITIPMPIDAAFRLVRVDTTEGETCLTDVPFIYADGMLTLEIIQEGVFLLIER